jgi:hypothetical protein
MGKRQQRSEPERAGQEPEGCKTEKLIFVSWKDHTANGGWIDVDEFHGPSLCHSVGWVMKEDDEGLTLAGSWSPSMRKHDEESAGNVQYLLKSCIVQRRKLTVQ